MKKKHTANTLEDLADAAKGNYTGESKFVQEQAVRDGNLITAVDTGYQEFAREVLYALDAYPGEYIDLFYGMHRAMFTEAMELAKQFNINHVPEG